MSIPDDHWNKEPDRASTLAGKFYVATNWQGNLDKLSVYRLLSHHDCGFHLLNVADETDRRCVSERAIGSSFHEMLEETPETMELYAGWGLKSAKKALELAGKRTVRFYRRVTTYHVEVLP